MTRLLLVLALAALAAYTVVLQRRLNAAQLRGDMYREIAARLDQQVST
jgi:hypothetical protein